ncbi:DUF308 domain-containing protein [Parafrigoribacterium soli]|uniref:DUF308 domain-containing protein n=1 Tax=Parafrigoribacterium soli TaxID=3144663 RepID=UPI0032EF7C08
MSALQDNAAQRAAYWPVPLIRAVPAAVIGLSITFTADHSARLGLVTFGVFAMVSGALLASLSWRRLAVSGVRPSLVTQGAIAVVLGLLAMLLQDGGTVALLSLFTVFALLTGFLELYSGLRTRGRFIASGDWRVGGILTVLAGVAFLLVPPELHQRVSTPEGTTGVLDASIVAVGILGAYGAILAIYLLIAGFSAKWGTQSASAVPAETQTKGGPAA